MSKRLHIPSARGLCMQGAPGSPGRVCRGASSPEMAYCHRRRQRTQGLPVTSKVGWGSGCGGWQVVQGEELPGGQAGLLEDGTAASGPGRNATAACGLSLSIGHGRTAHVQRKCWCGHALECRGNRSLSPMQALPLHVSVARPPETDLPLGNHGHSAGPGGTLTSSTLFSKVEGEEWPTAISRGRGGSANGRAAQPPSSRLCLTGSSGCHQSWLLYYVCSSFPSSIPN